MSTKIVEVGTHTEPMKMNGLYSSFYKMHFKEEKEMPVSETPITGAVQ
jgi:hypothetical protein